FQKPPPRILRPWILLPFRLPRRRTCWRYLCVRNAPVEGGATLPLPSPVEEARALRPDAPILQRPLAAGRGVPAAPSLAERDRSIPRLAARRALQMPRHDVLPAQGARYGISRSILPEAPWSPVRTLMRSMSIPSRASWRSSAA